MVVRTVTPHPFKHWKQNNATDDKLDRRSWTDNYHQPPMPTVYWSLYSLARMIRVWQLGLSDINYKLRINSMNAATKNNVAVRDFYLRQEFGAGNLIGFITHQGAGIWGIESIKKSSENPHQ